MTVDAPVTLLCVDDEPNILAALRRTLRDERRRVLTADGGEQALQVLASTPVDVVVSDMRMPGMDGARLLEQVHARWPGVERILLTGHSDMRSTVAAINQGQIFRYIHKPWEEHDLCGAIDEALERRALRLERDRLQRLTAEQNDALRTLNAELEARVADRTAELRDANDKLRRNYLKSIKTFTNLLELRGDRLAGHGRRVADSARNVARAMHLPDEDVSHVFVAGLIHDIGKIGLDDRLLSKPVPRYTPEEMAQYRNHPAIAEHALMAIEDLERVVPIIRSHHERFDGRGFPDRLSGGAIPLGARILSVADTYDDLVHGGLADAVVTPDEARMLMRKVRGAQFDPEVLDVFLHITEAPRAAPEPPMRTVRSGELVAGMVLARDLVSRRGVVMLMTGQALSAALIERIRAFEAREEYPLDIRVRGAAA